MSVIRGQHETAFRNLSCDIDRLRRGARDARWPLWAEHRDTDSDSSQSVLSYDHGHSRQMRRGRALMGHALVPRKVVVCHLGVLGLTKAIQCQVSPSCPERKSVQIRFLVHAVDAGVGRLPRFYERCGCVESFDRVPAGVHNVSTIGFSSECRGRGRNCCKCLKER